MTTKVPLLGSFWTLGVGADPLGDGRCLHDFRLRVETAAQAGFTGMGLWHADLLEILKTYSFKDMKSILDANGIVHIEVEWLLDWYYKDQRRAASDETRKLLLDAAETLRAKHIKIGDLMNDSAGVAQLTEEFAVLCKQAADRGTTVLFEMLPPQFSKAPSLEAVMSIVRGAGQKNGGIMLDNLHMQRTGTTPTRILLEIPRDIPLGVEINDGALAMPMPSHFEQSVVNRRMLPGDGEFDIAGFLHAVWTLGYTGPIGVEVLNEYMRKWPLQTAATEGFAKTSKVVNAARESWEALRAQSTTATAPSQ